MKYKVLAEAYDANSAVDVIEFTNGRRRVRIYDNAGGCWRVIDRRSVPASPDTKAMIRGAIRFVEWPARRDVMDAALGY